MMNRLNNLSLHTETHSNKTMRSFALLHTPLSSHIQTAPTGFNLIPFADMDGTSIQIKNMWLSRCALTQILASENPDLVYQGESSLHVAGDKKCFLFRPVGPACSTRRVTEPIQAGDTLKISLKVRITQPNTVFQMYTAHYHNDKTRKWAQPEDDSHMISRTFVSNANEWTTIEAMHKVADDWSYNGMILTPEMCNHYHLRFKVINSDADYYIDDVKVSKVGTSLPKSGFFINPGFEMDHQYWKYASTSGYIAKDDRLRRNVMVMKRNQVLRQNVLENAVPGQQYQFGFNIKLTDIDAIEMRIILRMKFINNDLENGPCHKSVCNFYKRPLATTIRRSQGGWQHVVTEKFDMFNFTDWDAYGNADFILFQMFTKDMEAGGEYRVTDFAMESGDYTPSPSMSLAPSGSPTNLFEEHIGYIVRYAGEVRTVVRQPFVVDKTGERLPMNETAEYKLCEVDEVEGRKAEVRVLPFSFIIFIWRLMRGARV